MGRSLGVGGDGGARLLSAPLGALEVPATGQPDFQGTLGVGRSGAERGEGRKGRVLLFMFVSVCPGPGRWSSRPSSRDLEWVALWAPGT